MAGIEDTIANAVLDKLKNDGTLQKVIADAVAGAVATQTQTLGDLIKGIGGGNSGNTGGNTNPGTGNSGNSGNTGGGTTTPTPGTGTTTPTPGNDGIADSGPLVSLNDFTNEDWDRGILNHTYKAFTVKMDDVVKYGIGKGGVVRWTGNKQSVNVLSIEGSGQYATVRTDTVVDPAVVGYPGQIEVLRKGLSVAESPYDGSDPKKPTGSDSNTGGSTAPSTGTPSTGTNPTGPIPTSPVADGDFVAKQGSGLMCLNMGMGAGGDTILPGSHGTNYGFPLESEIKRAVEKYNVRKFRIGFLWERIVKPGGRSELYMGKDAGGNYYTPEQLIIVLKLCKKYGATAMLDMHNYGGYSSTGSSANRKKIGNGVSAQQWANDWCALIRFLATDADAWSAIYGFDTMNEWESMTYATVKAACQTWLDVCAPYTGDKMCVFEGINFSSTRDWVKNNPDFYTLKHPRGKKYLEFSGHLYLDQDASGYYTNKGDTINSGEVSSLQSLASQKVTFETVGTARIAGFADWCKKNGVKGNIGENIVTGNLPNLLKGEAKLLDFCIDAGIDVYVFGMSDRFGDNHHNIELPVNAPMLKLFTDRTAKQYK